MVIINRMALLFIKKLCLKFAKSQERSHQLAIIEVMQTMLQDADFFQIWLQKGYLTLKQGR